MTDREHRVAFVSGGTRGIGAETCRALARRGIRVAFTGRQKNMAEFAATYESEGAPRALAIACDHTDSVATLGAFNEALKEFGRIDILVNNAADRGPAEALADVDPQTIADLLSINLLSPTLLCHLALRHMAQSGSGHIINVLSSACLHPLPTYALYTAAKRGLEGLTRVMMKEARLHGIKVSALFPGSTDTRFKFGPETPYSKATQIAEAILVMLESPPDAVIQEMVIRPLADSNY